MQTMHMSADFLRGLLEVLPEITKENPTPFHVYDEAGIRETGRKFLKAFSWHPNFKQFYAVKANPNPAILAIMRDMGFGFDCSSVPELILARGVGAGPDDIMFTSNNTTPEEYRMAVEGTAKYVYRNGSFHPTVDYFNSGGCILNLDDITYVEKAYNALDRKFPELICFRYNPGLRRTGNSIIGNPAEAKYGVPHGRIVEAYRLAQKFGATRFGLHTMICSNERNWEYMHETVKMILGVAEMVGRKLKIQFDFINIGGGFGIPYKPNDEVFDLKALGKAARAEFEAFERRNGYMPALYTECGRYIAGPHGVLVTTIQNIVRKYKNFILVDANEACLMRPMLYQAHHGIVVPKYFFNYMGKGSAVCFNDLKKYEIAGSLCENVMLAKDRWLPPVEEGDILLFENTGAHCLALTTNYNGRLRPAEFLLNEKGGIRHIRRAERIHDYFATLNF